MSAIGIAGGLGLIIVIVAIVLRVMYLITLMNLMKKVAAERRTMEPGLVWLAIIPFFYYIWNFIMVTRISESVGNEVRARGMHGDDKPGYGIGMAMAVCSVIAGISNWAGIMSIALIGTLAGLAALVLWIIYWVQMNQYSQRLGASFYDPNAPLDANTHGHTDFTSGKANTTGTSSTSGQGYNRQGGDYNDTEDF